jgi:DNA topoisomerase-3
MNLYLVEKASVGRALGAVLDERGGQKSKAETHIRCASGDVVAWASGHLLRLCEPEEYDANLAARWSLCDLPIIPERWELRAIERTKALLEGIGKLLKEAGVVIHAGDGDREGQLLIDEILEHARPDRA